jgi:multicomponent Na+:H+ antiporter subunit E
MIRNESYMAKFLWKRLLIRTATLSLLWWILTRGQWAAWIFGAPMIAAVVFWRLDDVAVDKACFRPWYLLTFVPYFFWKSFTGSCDVALRAIDPRMPIKPSLTLFVFRLPPQSVARVFCANCISMLPGTLCAAWIDDTLLVHLLVDGPEPIADLRSLEQRIGAMFGHNLNDAAAENVS